MNRPCAEVIASSITGWSGQCWDRHIVPAFGTLVVARMRDCDIFGVVYQIEAGVIDGARVPFAYQKSESELLRDQPQIFSFMKTTIHGVTVGYKKDGGLMYHVAPVPPPLHTFIAPATVDEQRLFFARPDFLPLLAAVQLPVSSEELLIALIRSAVSAGGVDDLFVERLVHYYGGLVGNDYHKVRFLVGRLAPLFSQGGEYV